MYFLHSTLFRFLNPIFLHNFRSGIARILNVIPLVHDTQHLLVGSDGSKRIAATLFLWFLNNNGILYREDGSKRLADNTLVALTLMIAESKTEEKDVMVKVVVNLINQKN